MPELTRLQRICQSYPKLNIPPRNNFGVFIQSEAVDIPGFKKYYLYTFEKANVVLPETLAVGNPFPPKHCIDKHLFN